MPKREKLRRTLKADQFCPHLPPFGSNNSIQAFFPTFSPKGLKANGQKALFISQKPSKTGFLAKLAIFGSFSTKKVNFLFFSFKNQLGTRKKLMNGSFPNQW